MSTAPPSAPASPALVYQTVTAIRIGLLCWARDTVILLRPDLQARRDRAAGLFEDDDPDVSRAAVDEYADVYAEATSIATDPRKDRTT